MKYCPNINNRDFYKWNHGFNPCFIETVSSTSMFLFIYIFGFLQIRNYKKYSTSLEYWQRPRNCGFYFQVCLICFISCLSLLRVVLQNTMDNVEGHFIVIDDKTHNFYYYTLIVGLFYFASWMMSLYLIFLERKKSLPGLPPRGHGLTLITFWALCLIWENLSFLNWWHEKCLSDKLEVIIFSLRYISTIILFLIGIKAPALFSIPINIHRLINIEEHGSNSDSWIVRILNKNQDSNNSHEDTNLQNSTWKNLSLKWRLFLPFLWPRGQRGLQFKMFLCILILIAGRVINVLLPITYKTLINLLTNKTFCWKTILLFVFLQFLQGFGVGGTGLLSNMRSFLWISIQQYSTKKLQVDIYTHILSLSLDWHVKKKTGEVLRILDRGTSSINNILNYVSFQVGPTLLDILVAIIFLMVSFGIWYSLIIVFTMALYIASTIIITEWRTKHRRKMNQLDNSVSSRATETLYNFETVKYNAAEWYEIRQYNKLIENYQQEEWITSSSLNALNSIQGFICVWIGLLGGALLCAKQIVDSSAIPGSHRTLTVGDFVLFISYLAQLYIPLNWFGTFYRSIQQSLIDLENMIDLMREPSFDNPKAITRTPFNQNIGGDVSHQDLKSIIPYEEALFDVGQIFNESEGTGPAAELPPIFIKRGTVEFKHVFFSYTPSSAPSLHLDHQNTNSLEDELPTVVPQKYILRDINFVVGHSSPADGNNNLSKRIPRILGIVGPSGAGKTTIMRLLFKLYSPTSGEILVDDQDISKVDPISLRRQLGLVAQDTNLFNQSVGYNIDYGTFRLPSPTFISKASSPDNPILPLDGHDINNNQRDINCDGMIKNAAEAAQIHGSIANFPNGYDTLVGEKGLRLSGGEKQRVAIARLILKSPKIILLDEATSSLDSSNESAIQDNLNALFNLERQATMIIIAHRLSTVVHADEIIVIDKGSISERGSHEQLIGMNGKYAEMWLKQLSSKSGNDTKEALEDQNLF